MKKLMLMLAMMFLLAGVVSADHSLSNVVNITMPASVVAGSPFEAEFSFDYFYGGDNEAGSPLIIQLNITSDDEVSYPVWKGDFKISGRVEKSWFFNLLTDTIEFNCSEEYEQTIEHPLDAQNVTAPDGTFYCYNEAGDLELNENDKVTLDIVSHQAIYPGKYDLTASMFYLTDERAPFVNITNKNVFERYYREIDNVEIFATINDGSDIVDKWGEAFLGYENWTVPFIEMASGDYRFSRNTPVDIVEGDYPLFVFAKDEYGNEGNDSVTLKIDRTAPEIVLVQPNNNSVYSENDSLIIEIGAVDAKAGLDNESVEYRLSEIVDGSFCPDSGVIFGNYSCYNSGWVSDWDSNFEAELNINGSDFVSGSYWLETRACDILGNCGVL